MSADTNTLLITLAIVGTVVEKYFARQDKKNDEAKAAVRAEKVEDVKTLLQTNTEEVTIRQEAVGKQLVEIKDQNKKLQNVADDSHKLLNNNMAVALKARVSAVSSDLISKKRIAELTQDPADVAAVKTLEQELKEAEFDLDEHMKRQVIMDIAVGDREEKEAGED